ncbi:uncharacterized protein LOC141825552 [Curcuma longa]|uniref:uncharacterized protein LOC141825552 n=1 Tax=Curcuma longa TaxID=136217 RepID=UPI003D9F5708
MASLPKRRKLEGGKGNVPSVAVNDSTSASSISSTEPTTSLQLEVKIQIQQAKKFAVSQVQQERCLGNYRSFDSPFGNYIVPVIPTRADLFG